MSAADRPDQQQAASLHTQIGATLASGFHLLRFPAALEPSYRQVHARRAMAMLQRMLPWVTLLYVAATAVMYAGSNDTAFRLWVDNALWPVAGAIAWLWIARFTGLLARHVHLHTGMALAVALFASVRTIFLLGDQQGEVYVTYQIIYLLFIAFTVAQLRLPQALAGTLLTGIAIVINVFAEGLVADWLAFGQYYLATTLIGAVIGYLIEHRERAEWLKSEQAALEKREMESLRSQADAESHQQRLLGDYLELTAGNLTATEIANRSLKFLIEHAHGQIGTVYLVDGERLRRAATWGLEGETRTADELGKGETLIGQAAENGRRMRLTHIPADYHPIRTGTGSVSPAELLVEPVQYQGATLAVIEMGALLQFSDNDIERVDRIGRAMGTMLVAANAREALSRAGMVDFTI